MTHHLRISSYRLAFWHAPKRARHEEGDDLDCVFCQFSEGVAQMRDVAGYLHRRGFTIADCDDRSLTLALDETSGTSDTILSHDKAALLRIISGQRVFAFPSPRFE
jgi:hypothetical protein